MDAFLYILSYFSGISTLLSSNNSWVAENYKKQQLVRERQLNIITMNQDQQSKLDPVSSKVAWDKTTQSNYELKYFNITRIQKCCEREACEAATAWHFKNLTMRLQFT